MKIFTVIGLLGLICAPVIATAQGGDPATLQAIGDISTKEARKALKKSIPKSPKTKHCAAGEWEKFGFRHGFYEFHVIKKLNVTLAKRLAKMQSVCGEAFDLTRYQAGLAVGTEMRCGYERGLVDGEYKGRDTSITCDLDKFPSYAIGYGAGNAYEYARAEREKRSTAKQTAIARHEAFKTELRMTPTPTPEMVRKEFGLSDAADAATKRYRAAEEYMKYLTEDYHIDTSGWLRYQPNINLDYTVPTSHPLPLR